MKTGIYPGSFDPVTYGHLDIIKRASTLFDKLYIAIMVNDNKQSDFDLNERIEMLKQVTKPYDNVEIVVGNGLTVDLAEELGAKFLVRGIRAVMDYEYELQLATVNMTLAHNIETVFLLTRPENSFLSSSIVKSVAKFGGELAAFVPGEIISQIKAKYQNDKE